MENILGSLMYGFAMILFMIGMWGMFVCYIFIPVRSLWLVYRKFKPNEKYSINQKMFKISIWFLCLSFAAIAGYHLFVLNIKYPDSFLTVIYHLIPLGFFAGFEVFQAKSYSAIAQQKVAV
jgi:hypothetical protein